MQLRVNSTDAECKTTSWPVCSITAAALIRLLCLGMSLGGAVLLTIDIYS